MPWQHWLVLGDFLLSTVMIFWFATRGYYQLTRKSSTFWLLWDVGVLYCLIAGAHEWTWQLALLTSLWLLGFFGSLKRRWDRPRVEVEPKMVTSSLIFTLIASTLLLMGQPG